MVDILKRGLDQRSEYREEGANPKKWTGARWAWTIKWTYGDPSARASGTIKVRIGEDAMREYTAKEMKLLKANPYTFKVTKNKLYFTVEFKEAFWTAYQAGMAPRKILGDLGYDVGMFGQKQIDSLVQRIRGQAGSVGGFQQGENRTRRKKDILPIPEGTPTGQEGALVGILNEVKYLRQEVEFLKKIVKTENTAGRKS